MDKLNGMEVSGRSSTYSSLYFSLWDNGCRLTGGDKLIKVFNYGILTGEDVLTDGAKMIMFGQLTKWSKE